MFMDARGPEFWVKYRLRGPFLPKFCEKWKKLANLNLFSDDLIMVWNICDQNWPLMAKNKFFYQKSSKFWLQKYCKLWIFDQFLLTWLGSDSVSSALARELRGSRPPRGTPAMTGGSAAPLRRKSGLIFNLCHQKTWTKKKFKGSTLLSINPATWTIFHKSLKTSIGKCRVFGKSIKKKRRKKNQTQTD